MNVKNYEYGSIDSNHPASKIEVDFDKDSNNHKNQAKNKRKQSILTFGFWSLVCVIIFWIIDSSNNSSKSHKVKTGPVSSAASCSNNAKCDGLGLKGLCCPGSDGANLSCCNHAVKIKTIATNTTDSEEKGDEHTTHSSCSKNKKCSALGLTGQCCPTSSGDNLSCCNDRTNANTERSKQQRQQQQQDQQH